MAAEYVDAKPMAVRLPRRRGMKALLRQGRSVWLGLGVRRAMCRQDVGRTVPPVSVLSCRPSQNHGGIRGQERHVRRVAHRPTCRSCRSAPRPPYGPRCGAPAIARLRSTSKYCGFSATFYRTLCASCCYFGESVSRSDYLTTENGPVGAVAWSTVGFRTA